MAMIWVTGAAGFIGGHLTRHLTSAGFAVAGLGGGGAMPDECVSATNGLIDIDAIEMLANSTGLPDTIYHLAGGSSVGASLADPYGDYTRTLGSTAAILEWVRTRSAGSRIVFVSSAAVYGVDQHGPIAVNAPLRPFSPYGHHKAAAEFLCRSYAQSFGLQIAVVRLFSVYGAGLRKQLLWDLCVKLARDGSAILGGTGAELRDWTDVRDVVRLLALSAPLADTIVPIINGGTGYAHDVATIAGLVARSFDLDAKVIDFSGARRAGDPLSLIADPMELPRGFSWSVTLEQGIRDYVAWFRDAPR